MAAKKKYLFAVQRPSGHEVLSAVLEVAKVADVEAQRLDDGNVRLVYNGDIVAWGTSFVPEGEELTLYRWPFDQKTGKAVEKPVKATNEEDSK